ncbi:MAG TPA: FAD-dependent oxidoreductase [Anaeromyxobacteraceae bacterium]|nr:FAD-dependent oxidoreductase [Anaeromyxobacteraceae bacterium]
MNSAGSPSLRASNLAQLSGSTLDVAILGGGINGAVIAAALAARGARVALLERGDFGSATSQQSSNLVWGGIKYLEGSEFGLVRKLCRSRNELLRAFPSAVEEIRFFTTHSRDQRHPRWKLVAGTWLYWALGGFHTRAPRRLSRAAIAREEPVIVLDGVDGGVEYSDAFLPDGDARFVWGFVRSALDRGCLAANYLEALGSHRDGEVWITRARERVTGRELSVRSRVLVNACGPWADEVNERDGVSTTHRHVLSKGIHLLVDRVTPHARVLTSFADDGRLFFAIPMGGRTCIGTTDTPAERPDEGVTAADRAFVLDNINRRLRLPRPLTERDIISERCGVRPLAVDAGWTRGHDWVQLSRRHIIETNPEARHVTVFGGKLTDCLNIGDALCAEVKRLGVRLPWPRRPWYGEPPAATRSEFEHQTRPLGLSEPAVARLWRRHGHESFALLDAIRRDPRGADEIFPPCGLLRCEVEAAARREMVVTLEDFLRRRTELAQLIRREELEGSPELSEVTRILFGDAASDRMAEWRGQRGGSLHAASA